MREEAIEAPVEDSSGDEGVDVADGETDIGQYVCGTQFEGDLQMLTTR